MTVRNLFCVAVGWFVLSTVFHHYHNNDDIYIIWICSVVVVGRSNYNQQTNEQSVVWCGAVVGKYRRRRNFMRKLKLSEGLRSTFALLVVKNCAGNIVRLSSVSKDKL